MINTGRVCIAKKFLPNVLKDKAWLCEPEDRTTGQPACVSNGITNHAQIQVANGLRKFLPRLLDDNLKALHVM